MSTPNLIPANPQPTGILDEQQPVKGAGLLDEDFRQTAPAVQPQQTSPEIDQLALDIRAGIIGAGLDPSQMSPESYEAFQEIIIEQRRYMLQTRASQEFLVRHTQDYLPCPQNLEAIQETLQSLGFDGTDPRQIEVAFNMLRSQGKLIGPQSQRPSSIGLSESQSVRQPVAQPMNDADLRRQLDALPLEQARALLLQRMQGQR